MIPTPTALKQKCLPFEGAHLDVLPISGKKSMSSTDTQRFCEIIGGEASSFRAGFDGQKFDAILNAISSTKARAYFLSAEWKDHPPHLIGATVHFASVIIEYNEGLFRYYPAPYIEDICIPRKSLLKFMRDTEAFFPDHSELGLFFLKETAETSNLFYGSISNAFIGEYTPKGKQIVRIFEKMNSTMGYVEDSAVLEIEAEATPYEAENNPSVTIRSLSFGVTEAATTIQPNVFIASWANDSGSEEIVASFTNTISTFTGDPIFRVQIISNGRTLEEETLPQILSCLLSAGKKEILERNWLYQNQSAANQAKRMIMRIHALNEPQIIRSLKKMGAMPRLLGGNLMLPVITKATTAPNSGRF